jgi:hypothetical protein
MKVVCRILGVCGLALALTLGGQAADAKDNTPPEGFTALFNGKDLSGWKTNKPDQWKAEDGVIVYSGKGGDLVTEKSFRNFILHADWKITKGGDSGIFPRGVAQIQIWDNKEGSGGLWNQGVKALKNADKPVGEWNRFDIAVEKDVVTVKVNGELVVDKYPNMFKKGREKGPIVLQNHGNPLWFKNIYIKELPD